MLQVTPSDYIKTKLEQAGVTQTRLSSAIKFSSFYTGEVIRGTRGVSAEFTERLMEANESLDLKIDRDYWDCLCGIWPAEWQGMTEEQFEKVRDAIGKVLGC